MPGRLMALGKRPEPCMPIPIWPKRMRSLAGTGFALSAKGSSNIVLAPSKPPAARALLWKKSRREDLFFMVIPRKKEFRRNYVTFGRRRGALGGFRSPL